LPAVAGLFTSRNHRDGSGAIVTEIRDFGAFDRIRSSGSFDVDVTIGPVQKVTVSFDDNLIDLVKTELRGRTLQIYTDGSFSSRKSCRVEITVPALEEAIVSGSGDLVVQGLSGAEFAYDISGSGDATLSGAVDEVRIEVSGSGDVDARDLKARRAYVDIAGSGDVAVWASELFEGVIAGSGDIAYYGNPEKVNRSVAGSGDIRKGE
nr:head GIN domain-containing protein [candidate division Zixibacteria bacterium]